MSVAPSQSLLPLKGHPVSPPRFVAGMALMYLTLLASFFSLNTPIEQVRLEEQHAGYLALATLALCVAAFVLTFGTARRGVFIASILIGLLLGGSVTLVQCLLEQPLTPMAKEAGRVIHSANPTPEQVRSILPVIAMLIALAVAVPPIEEIGKLVPVLLLCRRRIIPDMRSAMLCGALAGMMFGLVEANVYAFTEYGPEKHGAGQWVLRYYGMCLTHALWDALGCALMFTLRPRGAVFKAWAIVSIIHLAHNLLQLLVGPAMQCLTMILLLFPIYVLGKKAWHAAKAPDDLQPASGMCR